MLTKKFIQALIKNRENWINEAIFELLLPIYSVEMKTLSIQKIKRSRKKIYEYQGLIDGYKIEQIQLFNL